MVRAWLHVVVYALPALLVSGVVAAALFGAAAGVMWLFVFGDDPWPRAAEAALGLGFAFVWLTLWGLALSWAFSRGKRWAGPGLMARADLAAAAGVTFVAIGAILLHQWSVGNLGAPSDSEQCSSYCQLKGFSGSSMPPRNTGLATCTCLAADGREALTVPLSETAR